jgi:hypothetical protein
MPARRQLRIALPLLFMLFVIPASGANPSDPPQSPAPGHSALAAETGGTGTSLPGSPAATGAKAALNDGREDLTVFFTIGVIIDVLLVATFLVWAAGQWRKTRK